MDYHTFIFNKGKLLGNFEEMYKMSSIIPWKQDKVDQEEDIKLLKVIMEGHYHSIVDISCGLGYYLDYITKTYGYSSGNSFGYDVSPTCCKRAYNLFPKYSFLENDITKNSIKKCKNKCLFCMRGTLWYVFPDIKNVFHNIWKSLKKEDVFLLSQNFPPLTNNYVGKDIISSYYDILCYTEPYFKLNKYIWYETKEKNINDNWFIGVFSKK